jgi:Domain of unknown function (DUF1844)
VPVSNGGKEIKITDKRMFTADGELREEYRFLDQKATTAPAAASPAEAQPPPPPPPIGSPPAAAAGERAERSRRPRQPEPEERRRPRDAAAQSGERGRRPRGWEEAEEDALGAEPHDPAGVPPYDEPSARLEIPGSPPGMGPSFYDLAAVLAEPVPVYLGDVELPDGQSAENLEMARLYIDLLDVLRQKTSGNLTAQEAAFLEDLLYRLRVRYVQKRG